MLSGPPPYLKHFRLTRFPFRQQPDPEVFFLQAGRDKILQDLCADIIGNKPLLKLTGGEGTGKTLLYKLLVRKLNIKKFEIVCLEHPAGSFEELLRLILMALGQDIDGEANSETGRNGYQPQLLVLLREKKAVGQRVALLIDEAEQLFLATLERLVRLVADIGEEGLLPILLVGRPELDRNLQQLSSYCNLADIHAGYFLTPLDFLETESYLRFRLVSAGCSAEKAGEIFSGEATSALYLAARGNLTLTHLLAERALVRAYGAGMFQVSAELIFPREESARGDVPTLDRFLVLLRRYRLQVLAGSFLALTLLLVAVWPDGEEAGPSPSSTGTEVLEEKQEPVAEIAAAKGSAPEPGVAEAPASKPVSSQSSRSTKGGGTAPAPSAPAKSVPGNEAAVSTTPSPSAVDDEVGIRGGNRKAAAPGPSDPEAVQPPASSVPPLPVESAPPALPLPEPVAVERQAAPPAVAEVNNMPESLPPAQKKPVVLQAQARKRKVGAESDPTGQPATSVGTNPQQLFTERMRASARWRTRSGYTIQLMVLASATAEESFKELLAQKQYATVKDNLYLVRKEAPPTLYIYYGSFASMEEARQGRDRLPDFLRKNQPYPLPIAQAAKKAKE